MKICAWRLLLDGLSMMLNKKRHHIERISKCPRCGMCDEDTFHTMIICLDEYTMWLAMSKVWNLPAIDDIVYTRPEWLFDVLRGILVEDRCRVLLLIWRTWHLQNATLHDRPNPSWGDQVQLCWFTIHNQVKWWKRCCQRKAGNPARQGHAGVKPEHEYYCWSMAEA